MANRQQLSILKQGALPWNEWRKNHPDVQPDLSEGNLAGANLPGANLRGANLGGAELASADLQGANLLGATLVEANLHQANLHKADLGFADLTFAALSDANLTTARLWKADLTAATLTGANLTAANLTMTTLRETDFSDANLAEAILDYAILVETNLRRANLTGCSVCGLSSWHIHLEEAQQANLVITGPNEPAIMVDTLEVAQLLYLLLNNKQLHQVITSITSNIVLILGRFTPERKHFLDAIRDELRVRGYTPLLFNFEMPLSHDFSASLRTLARIARFIIADLSRHKSIAQELRTLLPDTVVPVQPLLNGTRKLYHIFPDFKPYPHVLPGHRYSSVLDLQTTFEEKVIKPAEEKAKELAGRLVPSNSTEVS
ncbi:MAG TPA: pentapeptide repeat-containing protein [Ktedonobacteraceae bacterium]|nr:pentapeptide repeat-containing protein [Ktedonobacteraceae bacterium]